MHLEALTDEQYRAVVAVASATNYACGAHQSSSGSISDEAKEGITERLRDAIKALDVSANGAKTIVEGTRALVAARGIRHIPYEEIRALPEIWSGLVAQMKELRETRANILRTHPDFVECFTEDDDERFHALSCDLQSAAHTVSDWTDDFEDAVDTEIARRCIAEISADPDSLVTGEAAEAEIRSLIEDD